MKRCWITVLAAGAALSAGAAQAADLTLNLTTQGAGGTIAVAIYDEAGNFTHSRRPLRTVTARRTGAVTRVVISDLPAGRYAVAAFHDTDGDGDLTLWPIGLPGEAYGFSLKRAGPIRSAGLERHFLRPARGRLDPGDHAALTHGRWRFANGGGRAGAFVGEAATLADAGPVAGALRA